MWIGAVLGLSLVILVFAAGFYSSSSTTGNAISDLFRRPSTQQLTTQTQPITQNVMQVGQNLYKGIGVSGAQLAQRISLGNIQLTAGTQCTPPGGDCVMHYPNGTCITSINAVCMIFNTPSGRFCCGESGSQSWCVVY